MKNAIFAAALLISGTMLLCADAGFFSVIGIGFMILSFVIWLYNPIAKYFSSYFQKSDQKDE